MNQEVKVNIQHAMNLNKFKSLKDYQQFLLERIHTVDWLQPWGDLKSDFAIEKSFTWLDWLIIEKAIPNPNYKLSEIADKRKMQLALNILPDGETILHRLAALKNANISHIETFSNDLFQLSKKEV